MSKLVDSLFSPFAWIGPLEGTTTYFSVFSLRRLQDPVTDEAVAPQITAARRAVMRNLL